jgi:hypothetical protein
MKPVRIRLILGTVGMGAIWLVVAINARMRREFAPRYSEAAFRQISPADPAARVRERLGEPITKGYLYQVHHIPLQGWCNVEAWDYAKRRSGKVRVVLLTNGVVKATVNGLVH